MESGESDDRKAKGRTKILCFCAVICIRLEIQSEQHLGEEASSQSGIRSIG
jgi:hypothetical protein